MSYELPRGYLSASQINKYLSCPRQYEKDYILNLKPETKRPVSMSVGSSVHKMVEVTLEANIKGLEYNFGQVEVASNIELLLKDSDFEEETLEYWYTYSQILYKTWYKELGQSIMPIATEQKFESFVGDVPVLGYIDYLDISSGQTEICDLKVVKRAKSETDCKNSVQLAMYAITQNNPCVRFDSVVKNKKPKVGVSRHVFSKGELNYFTDLIGEVATNISAGNFPMTAPTSWMCNPKWCDFYNQCRGANNG